MKTQHPLITLALGMGLSMGTVGLAQASDGESLLKDNGLYKRLKARDLIQESLAHQGFIERIIQDVKEMMYY